jgi:hypothetical protein
VINRGDENVYARVSGERGRSGVYSVRQVVTIVVTPSNLFIHRTFSAKLIISAVS